MRTLTAALLYCILYVLVAFWYTIGFIADVMADVCARLEDVIEKVRA